MVAPGAEIRVQVVLHSPLIRDALSASLSAADGMTVIAALATPAEALQNAVKSPADIVLMGVFDTERLFLTAEQIMRQASGTKLVFLEDRAADCHVREALRINAAGYLTCQQPLREIEHALRRVARGLRVYAPEVASRLVLGRDGMRLTLMEQRNPFALLSPRERDVLGLLSRGYSVKQCASFLGIGISTAGNHKSRMMKKLGVHKTIELAHLAIREGLIAVTRRGDPSPTVLPITTPFAA